MGNKTKVTREKRSLPSPAGMVQALGAHKHYGHLGRAGLIASYTRVLGNGLEARIFFPCERTRTSQGEPAVRCQPRQRADSTVVSNL